VERLILLLCLIALALTAFAQCGDDSIWCNPGLDPLGFGDSTKVYYDMDSLISGEMYDFSGHCFNGTITGSPVDSVGYGGGCSGTCLYFDGINDRIDILPNTVLLLDKQQWMICAWYKSHVTNDSYDRIISQYAMKPDCDIEVDGSGHLRGFIRNSVKVVLTSTTVIEDGDWHFCMLLKDETDSVRLYVDNIQEAIGYYRYNNLSTTSTHWSIGATGTGGDPINALIDHVRIMIGDSPDSLGRYNLYHYNSISGACAAAPVGGAKIRGAYIDGKLQTWRTQ